MAEKQVAMMKLKVDLQCHKCYMKVKKVLSKFPQIRDQIFDEKNDTVTIKVVCCSPEKLRDRLCCYGGGFIKSIEIVQIIKPKPPGNVIIVDQPPIGPTPRVPAEPEKPKSAPPAAPPPAPAAKPPPPPAVKFPEPVPVSVLAYPSPAFASVVGRGSCWPAGYYGRPIYDSYGGNMPSYVGCSHCQHLSVEEDAPAECTIA